MLQTLARFRAFRYLAYAAAFVLWVFVALYVGVLDFLSTVAWEWRAFCHDVRRTEDTHKVRPCAKDCGGICCHFGCEMVSGHRWETDANGVAEITLWPVDKHGQTGFIAGVDFRPVSVNLNEAWMDFEDTQADEVWCDKAPDGWYCTGHAGHQGPCAAVPVGVSPSSAPKIVFSDGIYIGVR